MTELRDVMINNVPFKDFKVLVSMNSIATKIPDEYNRLYFLKEDGTTELVTILINAFTSSDHPAIGYNGKPLVHCAPLHGSPELIKMLQAESIRKE